MKKDYKTIRNYDYIIDYKFAGYGLDANAIFAKYETKFNISNGVIYTSKFVGYCTKDKKAYTGFIR